MTAAEISALTGLGRGAARQLVAVSPASTRVPVREALRAGVATWTQVEHFWRLAGQLPHEDAGDVARSLFATTDTLTREGHADDGSGTPGVAVERLDPDGALNDGPWGAKQFVQALHREVTRARSADLEAAARARAARHRARTAYAIVDDDGTGQVVITGDAVGTTACADRLYLLAKKAHAAGDERTEAQLRSDIARALLLHGTLPLLGLAAASTRTSSVPDDGLTGATAADLQALVTPDDIATLAQIISGTPSYELQVVVPWPSVTCTPEGHHDAGPTGTAGAGGAAVAPTPAGTAGASGDATDDDHPPTPDHGGGPARHPVDDPGLTQGVGRVVGRASHFVTPGSIRDMVLSPGTTLHRLLTDPADGRCRERSLARYQPDAAMRRQVLAADLLSRAPDGVLPVRDGQLDHVTEYLLGGSTTEGNLQGLDTVVHALKTEKFWDAEIDASRTVTWTSLFGRHYRTRPHDYRQYLGLGDTAAGHHARTVQGPSDTTAGDHARTGQGPGHTIDIRNQGDHRDAPPLDEAAERRHLASLMVYAALAHRSRTDRLDAADDDPDSDAHLVDDGHRVVWVRQTRQRDGRRVTGPRPGTPTPDRLLDSSRPPCSARITGPTRSPVELTAPTPIQVPMQVPRPSRADNRPPGTSRADNLLTRAPRTGALTPRMTAARIRRSDLPDVRVLPLLLPRDSLV